jgi:transcription elongation factor Elf1
MGPVGARAAVLQKAGLPAVALAKEGISPALARLHMEAVSETKDITFACSHCASALVVDAAAAGLTLPCQRCGLPTNVPKILAQRAPDEDKTDGRLNEVRRQLKENESQRTEITGCINQLTIQLHRWQLRLQTLDERRRDLQRQFESPKNSS